MRVLPARECVQRTVHRLNRARVTVYALYPPRATPRAARTITPRDRNKRKIEDEWNLECNRNENLLAESSNKRTTMRKLSRDKSKMRNLENFASSLRVPECVRRVSYM